MAMRFPLCIALLFHSAFALSSWAEKPTGIYFPYAIYFTPKPKVDAMDSAIEIHKKSYADKMSFLVADVAPTKGVYVTYKPVKLGDYPPPPTDYLDQKGFGLSKEQKENIGKSESVLMINFFIAKPTNYDFLKLAASFAADIAETTDGVIWDEETREMFGPKTWRERRLPTDHAYQILANTTLHIVEQPNKTYRANTLGMRKMGLPDLEVADFPPSFTNPVMALLKFLVEEVSKPGPLNPKISWTSDELRERLGLGTEDRCPEIKFAVTKPREGDPRNDVLTLDPHDLPGKDYTEKLAFLIDSYFQPDQAVLSVYSQREKLLELSKAARSKLLAMKASLAQGPPTKEQVMLKAHLDGEYLWVSLDRWIGEKIEGKLVKAPTKSKTKKPGDAVSLDLEQVFDYVHKRADGSEMGNETGKLIEQLAKEAAKSSIAPQAK